MRTLFHPHGRRGTSGTLLKPLQAWVKMRDGFGSRFSWQDYLVNLDDVLTGSKAAFCETVVIFDFGHDDFCCSALRILISLTQPSRQFGRVGSLSLWRGANFDMAPATFLALCACRIALVLARC